MPDTLTVEASDGFEIATYRWAAAAGTTPRGVVQVIHGVCEHAGRYGRLADHLCAAGFEVWAHDHRGHGRNAPRDEDYAFFGEREGWAKVVSDARAVRAQARKAAEEGPCAVIGHSMGSWVALASLIENSDGVEALVLSGSKRPGGLDSRAAHVLASVECARQGPRGRSRFLDFVLFGNFNRAFAPTRTRSDWLSRDPAEVDAYLRDPRCGELATNQLWRDLFGGLLRIDTLDVLRQLPAGLPIFAISGQEDPMAKGVFGVSALVERLNAVGLMVDLRLYPGGRHEVFNETNRQEVMDDVRDWLLEQMSTPSHPARRQTDALSGER